MDFVIRKMTIEDIDQVLEIEKSSFTTPWSRDAFVVEVTENMLAKYIVADYGGMVVGYGGIWLIIDEGHVTNIAVLKEYRGIGIGKEILKGLIDICNERNINAMTLEVRRSNEIAKSLYRQYGFKEYGIRPNYYADDNEDAIIMWRRI